MIRNIIFSLFLILSVSFAHGQSFDAKLIGNSGLKNSKILSADFDGNQQLDFLIVGENDEEVLEGKIYSFDESGQLVEMESELPTFARKDFLLAISTMTN